MKCNNCCKKSCKKCCCPYPRCMLGQPPKKMTPEAEKLKKYLSLPFPEDEV